MTRFPEGVHLNVLPRPRQSLFGAALLLILLLTSCGAPLPGESWPGISTDGQFVYVAYHNRVMRVNPVPPSGDERSPVRRFDWIGQLADDKIHMYAPPAISADGIVYVGAYDHKVYAFSLTSGLLTTFNSDVGNDKVIGGALIAGDTLYVGNGDKGARALDRTTGARRWDFTDMRYGVWSTPILVGDTLYCASLDHFIYALDAANGTLKWKVDLNGAIAGTPLYANGILYAGTFGNEIVAVSLERHEIINRYATEGWVWGTPVMLNGTLYFGDLKGWVYALDASTFKLKWQKNDPERPGAIRGKLALTKLRGKDGSGDKDIVIAGSESKYLHAYDAQTGDLVWTSAISANDQVLSDLIVIGDDVIFTTLSESQLVAAFNTQNGQKSWEVNYTSEMTRVQTATNPPVTLTTITPAPTAADSTAAPTASVSPASTATSQQ
jgi:outer membrane protein assembly factor BamB